MSTKETVSEPKGISVDSQADADKDEAKRIVKLWESIDAEVSNWKTHCQEVYSYIVPRKNDFTSVRPSGDERGSELFDSTAILANEKLASALHGMLTNPETKFFEITFGDPTLDEDEEVKNWCQETGNRMFRVLNNSNFQTEIYEEYIDLGAIGMSCLFMGESDENVLHFSSRSMKEIRVRENNMGLIDTVLRGYEWRASQCVDEFGEENCPDFIVAASKKDNQTKYFIIHSVEPLPKKNAKGHTFKSSYVLRDKKFLFKSGKGENGFWEAPYAVPRWSKVTGETTGRGPGMSTLPDIRMINAMMETVIQAGQITVAPPMQVEDDSVIGDVRLTPLGVTVVRQGSEIKPLITGARIDYGQNMLEDVRGRINAGFYVDQLTLKSGPQMTAEEVIKRTEEMLRLMGPILGRQHFELLRPLITRVYGIMDRRGLLPPKPAIVNGKKFDVRYSSLIARAQRMAEGQNLVRAMSTLQPLAQLNPQSMDIIDMDQVYRNVWDIYGLRHNMLKTSRDLKKQREADAQMKQKAMQQQQEAHEAEVAGKTAPMMAALKKGMTNGTSS
jgi:hypothetical protein